MKDNKRANISAGVQDLCRKLKLQLEALSVEKDEKDPRVERDRSEQARRIKLMEQLKRQLSELT